jgi:hypothetical protein
MVLPSALWQTLKNQEPVAKDLGAIDDQVDAGDLSKVFEVFCRQRLTDPRVMCTSRVHPGGGRQFEIGFETHRARATGSFGNGCSSSMTSTSLTIIRKQSPMSTVVATTAGPGEAVKARRTGSDLPPIPSAWTSSAGLAAAIDGQIPSETGLCGVSRADDHSQRDTVSFGDRLDAITPKIR